MTRQQIIAAAEQIVQAVEQAGIAELLDPTGERSLQDYLKSFKQYNILAEKFSEGALFLEKELGFASLREPDPWIIMSKKGELEADNPLLNISGVLATLTAVGNMLSESQSTQNSERDRAALSLVLFEQANGMPSTPRRIADALESIASLYEACARLQSSSHEDLCVVSCDSGSDKVFVFEGNAGVIGALKELIQSIWERIVFYRERTLQERISLLTHSLPVLDKVAELQLHGTLSQVDAEHTRKAIVSGVKCFLASGSMMQKAQENEAIDARLLIVSETSARSATPAPPVASPRPAPAIEPEPAYTPPPATHPEPSPAPAPRPQPAPELYSERVQEHLTERARASYAPSLQPPEPIIDAETDLTWDGILEDDLKTLRELIDKTKRSDEDHG